MRVCDAMLPALGLEFRTSTGAAAAAISAFAMAYGLLQLFYGPVGDRLGKLRVIGCATLACTVGNAAAAFAQSLDGLIAARIVSGVAAAGIVPLTMAWIGDNVAYAGRQEVLAKLLGATVFGMITGQWLGGLFADAVGWRYAFILLSAMFLVGGTMLLLDGRRGEAVTAHAGKPLAKMLQVVERPWVRCVLCITCLEGALAYSALAFIPTYIHGRFGLSMPAAGAIVALYGFGGLVYSRCAKLLLRTLREAGLASLGAVCLLLAFASLAWSQVWQWTLPACLVAGFGFYALHNTLQTHATQMAPAPSRGTAVSLFVCVLFLGQSAGVAAAGWLVDRYSAFLLFAIAAFGLLALGLTFAALLITRAQVASAEGDPTELTS